MRIKAVALLLFVFSLPACSSADEAAEASLEMGIHNRQGGVALVKSYSDSKSEVHSLELIDSKGRNQATISIPTKSPLTSACFSDSGESVALTNESGNLLIYHIGDEKFARLDASEPSYICGGAFSQDGQRFSAVTPGLLGRSTLMMWNLRTRDYRKVHVDENLIDGLFLSDSSYFYSTDKSVQFVDERNTARNYKLEIPFARVVVAPDRETCVLLTCRLPFGGFGPWFAEVRNIPQNKQLAKFEICPDSLIVEPVFSYDSKTLYYGKQHGEYASLEIESGVHKTFKTNKIPAKAEVYSLGSSVDTLKVLANHPSSNRGAEQHCIVEVSLKAQDSSTH